MKNIFFLSASDRLNYGDLLFPILFKKVLQDKKIEFNFFNHGLVKSNHSKFEALKTNSYKNLQKKISKTENPILVIGGGEVLFPTFTILYSYINWVFNFLIKFHFIKKIETKHAISSRLVTSKKIIFPFTPSRKDFKNKNLKIVYNAAGGAFSNKNKKDKSILVVNLNASDFVSVRDNRSYKSLIDEGVETVLSPDSAIIMSDYYSIESLKKLTTINHSDLPESYYMVQIGENKLPKDFSVFFEKLVEASRANNTKILLCPIGLALGHNDYKVLKTLKKRYPEAHLVLPKNIFDVMSIIGSSKCYLGTSLHGLITAQSFNVPFFLFNKLVPKLSSYCKTWIKEFYSVDEKPIDEIINKWDHKLYIQKTKEQKQLVYNNYDLMFSKF